MHNSELFRTYDYLASVDVVVSVVVVVVVALAFLCGINFPKPCSVPVKTFLMPLPVSLTTVSVPCPTAVTPFFVSAPTASAPRTTTFFFLVVVVVVVVVAVSSAIAAVIDNPAITESVKIPSVLFMIAPCEFVPGHFGKFVQFLYKLPSVLHCILY